MKSFPFLTGPQSRFLLRLVAALLMMAHGAMRLIENSLSSFGEFLNGKGFLIGTPIAWSLTLFELIGGILMILGFFVRWVALGLIIELLMGIILVHAQNGWFVVGHQTGGVEYSVLLIVCLLVVAANDRNYPTPIH